jgi:hypothetical protein
MDWAGSTSARLHHFRWRYALSGANPSRSSICANVKTTVSAYQAPDTCGAAGRSRTWRLIPGSPSLLVHDVHEVREDLADLSLSRSHGLFGLADGLVGHAFILESRRFRPHGYR